MRLDAYDGRRPGRVVQHPEVEHHIIPVLAAPAAWGRFLDRRHESPSSFKSFQRHPSVPVASVVLVVFMASSA